MAEPSDVNVDELRRRARRRLVGAIVLALAAAVFVPMLLENEPKPLGEDISVRIPPVDDGKFVNRLSGGAPSDPGKAPITKSEIARTDTAKSEAPKTPAQRVEAAKGDIRKPEGGVDVAKGDATGGREKSTGNPASQAEPAKSEPQVPKAIKSEPQVAKAPAPLPAKGTAAPASASQGTPASTALPAATSKTDTASDFTVQVAAFSDDKGANSLANRLKQAGYPAYTEAFNSSRGTVWRVRVGPFTSRDAAAASRDKLKADGYAGIVAQSK